MVLTEFNNCFIIQSPSLFFYIKYLREGANFTQERSQEGKRVLSFTHEQNIICSQKLDDIAHEQTIICRHLFAGHVVGS